MKEKPRILINPPPADRRCSCCRKRVSELKSFGGKGDPLVGDFSGAKLVKIFRSMAPRDKEVMETFERIEKEYYKDGYTKEKRERLIQAKGEKFVNNLEIHIQLMDTVEASWECRDCIILSSEDYFEKKFN